MLTTLKEATLIIWIFQAYLGVDCSLAGECCLHCVEPNKADTSAVKFCGTGAVARVELDDPIFLRGETVDAELSNSVPRWKRERENTGT